MRFLLAILIVCAAGCATKDGTKGDQYDTVWHRSGGETPWYAPDVDSQDKSFFYDSWFRN